ncbi:MAG: hypothetical protein HYW93_01875 [Thaumarchaeota archaeon]|nr:hypothetical protein [Nitrososphaerota archaeon]
MPYIPAGDRPLLDEKVEALAEELASKLSSKMNGDTEISSCYKDTILIISKTLYGLESGQRKVPRTRAEVLAHEIFTVAKKHGYRGAWLGTLNYSLTRLIQVLPARMKQKMIWKEELRYWIHAQTIGALEGSAMAIHSKGKDDWITDGLVGVLIDVKDEYKRRVSTAYEAFQIRKSGDCYTTPYRTELVEVKDEKGKVTGYQEVMKNFRTPEEEG